MGKTRSKKKYSGSNVRHRPTDLTVVTEDDLDGVGDDVWQRITQQLQLGEVIFRKVVFSFPLKLNYLLASSFGHIHIKTFLTFQD